MSSQRAPFVYTPLQPGEIRLLYPDIQPSGDTHWSLKIVQLRDQNNKRTSLEYDALSYTWGDLSQTFPIVCNNQELHIHHNLNIALPFLARRDSKLPIWIDAVCINQKDDTEKFKQIRMMIDIYSRASQVWIWFGPGNKESGTVISMLPQIMDSNVKDLMPYVSTDPKVMPWLSSEEAWSSFYDLVENKWYSRLWVFQETAFPRKIRVLLGDNEVAWDMLQRLFKPTDWHFAGTDGREPRKISKWAREIFRARRMTQRAINASTSLTAEAAAIIVMSTMTAYCFDPRDRIHALLGYITIQVTEDMPLEDMYTQLARAILLNLDLESPHWWSFLHLATSANKRSGLPSWCPDFHDVAGRSTVQRNTAGHAASTRKNKAQREYDLMSKELVLRGQIFDTVETIFEEFVDGHGATSQQIRTFHSWEESLEPRVLSALMSVRERKSPIYVDEAAIKDAYWTTLLAGANKVTTGRISEKMKQVPYKTLQELRNGQYAALKTVDAMELLEQSAFSEQNPSRETFPEVMRHFAGVMPVVTNVEESRIFITAQGRLGRGPSSIKQGDSVCIFSFAYTAHVIRRTSNENQETFELLGDSYVHGMMNGEIEGLGVEEQDVVLV